jgi:hypothetical protein
MPHLSCITPVRRPGTHCIGGWVGPRAGLDGQGKSLPHWDLISGPSSLYPGSDLCIISEKAIKDHSQQYKVWYEMYNKVFIGILFVCKPYET